MASNQNPGRKQPMDPLLQQRLNQGGARRTGQPLPPPAPGRAAQQGSRQAQSVRPGQAPRAVINTGTDARRTIPTPGRPAAAGAAPRQIGRAHV